MKHDMISKILIQRRELGKPVTMKVEGDSMLPALKPGDLISVVHSDRISEGDILAFFYRHGEVLVHRCVKLTESKIYCKGDNAFRLEDITPDRIIGHVTAVVRDGGTLPVRGPDRTMAALSYKVGREFVRRKYDPNQTRESEIYKLYEQKYLKQLKND
jgi:hypothetical protein